MGAAESGGENNINYASPGDITGGGSTKNGADREIEEAGATSGGGVGERKQREEFIRVIQSPPIPATQGRPPPSTNRQGLQA